jgi:hypothetical protein
MQRMMFASLSVARIGRVLGGVFNVAILLAVPAIAICSIAPWIQPVEANQNLIPIAPGDELAAYGMQSARQTAVVAKHTDELGQPQSIVFLRNWEYTGGPGKKRSGQP